MIDTESVFLVAKHYFDEGKGHALTQCLVDIGFCSSKSEAKRAIEQGSVKYDDQVIHSPNARVVNFTDAMFCIDKWKDGTYNVIGLKA